ncbi:MAG: TonB-dependent receptor [Bacteroidia bacterium]|nr:TonB-dependent receptor [Bacteroidia bacterium]NNF29875.1 TonB-dependent receptor [Flavobacteriaceae bacterium]MBT8277060.1 TonB-dependent receptor [Bacteroidia bacterium]NNJ82305.1 TonB-dependent receptor [Flavobacteriaceae bacterium]NNK54170.1 TonB-dependent receptor [Flavobacteriaceae bacterium]
MKQLFVAVVLLFGVTSYAGIDPDSEIKGKISGRVIDKDLQQPIPYATIVVKTMSGEIITGGVTDDLGNFKIEDLPEGNSIVNVQFIGYRTFTTEIEVSRRNRNIDLGEIFLEEDVSALDEVTVVAERSTIQQKLDRKVITIGKDLQTAGPTASDIMNNLPSVNVDQQTGALSLRGNQNVRVMVDGKLTNVPVAQLLKQIPSTSIKQIELITNPSAKYNPEGMSGIINIVLHKNLNIGFNGNASVGLTYEEQAKFNSSIDMNYRNGKINLFGNWGHNSSKNENFGNIFRPDDNSEQLFEFLDDSRSNLVKVGIDFYLNDKNTLSFFTNQNFFDGGTGGLTDIVYYSNSELNQTQDFLQERDNLSSQYNFNYKLDFDKEGHNIELEADFNTFTGEEDALFQFTGASIIDDYMDFVDTDRERLTVNLDYVNPLNETTKLEIGGEARLFETNLEYMSTGQTFNSEGELIPTPDTNFDYKRDIYSAYVTYGKSFDKWSVQLGARFETVDVKADTNTVRSFTNDYMQVYPSAFVTYTPSEANQFQVSYSRRVDRPGLSQVNPIREWSTPLISSFGNTSLEPQFTNSIEANYTKNLKKGSITGGVFYRAIEDEINRAVFVDRTDLSKVILTFDNFDNTSAYGIELSSNYRPTNWWNFNFSFDLYTQTQKGITESLNNPGNDPGIEDIVQEVVEVDNTAWNLRMFNNFKATKNLTFSAFGFYRGQNRGLQFEVEPMYFVNIGARYNLWEGRGTFSVNYNDIFDTMRFRFDGQRPYAQMGEFNWESNTIFVGLSYRFGGGKYRAKSRKRRDNDEKSGSGGIF